MGDEDVAAFRAALLHWYDVQGRDLPWRVRDGKADPYRVWLSEVMLQQTTVAHGTPYWERFTAAFPTICDLAETPTERVMGMWAGLGYYARARNLHLCAKRVCQDMGGEFPTREAELLELPGIGPYTAAAIAAICGEEAANVVDGNVERVVARLFAVARPLPRARAELRRLAGTLVRPERPGDYAQALMDLGATLCRPKRPSCPNCPVRAWCAARREGEPERYPAKTPKAPLPVRRGTAWVARDGRRVWLERRPESGLLGGMLGFPTTEWVEGAPPQAGPSVRHTFSHFHLELTVERSEPRGEGAWYPVEVVETLPSLMKKVWKAA